MKTKKMNHILQALSKSRIDHLTKESLVRAFNDDGIADLESAAGHLVTRFKKDIEVQKTEPHLIDFSLLSKRTPSAVANAIVHTTPTVPFILDGTVFDPKDIARFNGEALVFTPFVNADGSSWLQVFHEDVKQAIAGYFQIRQINALLNPLDFSIPGVSTPPAGTPPGPPVATPPGGFPPIISQQPEPPTSQPGPPRDPEPPVTYNTVKMFDDDGYSGNWFWLEKGYMWKDLSRVSRGGLFGGDWNDAISSLSNTNTSCIYCENSNFEGSTLVVPPNSRSPHLSSLGWNDRISSAWNYG